MISVKARPIGWWLSLAIVSVLSLSACNRISVLDAADAQSAANEPDTPQRDARDAVAPKDEPSDANPVGLVSPQQWDPLPSVHERAWIEWVRSTAAQTGWWHGGDGNGSIELPDGTVWHFFSDTYHGLVDADFSRGSASNHLATNSIVIRDADGSFVGQVWNERIATEPPSHAAAIAPDPDVYPDNFYWFPGGVVIEDGELRLLAGLMQRNPIERVETHILTIDTDSGAVTDAVETGVTALDFNPSGLFEDAGWIYLHGRQTGESKEDGWGMMRAPVGNLRDAQSWQAWDGKAWSDDLAAHTAIEATDGGLLPTYGVYYDFRPSPHGYLALSVPLGGGPSVHIAESPQGPYQQVGELRTDTREGEDANGGFMGAYSPRWHPHYDTAEGLVVSYATNYFRAPDIADTDHDNRYYMPHYLTIPRGMIGGVVAG